MSDIDTDLEIEQRDVDEIEPYENNPQEHPESQIDEIVNSMERFDWTNPIIITSDNEIVAGHGRLAAAKEAGVDEIPCIVRDYSEEEARALRIADNKLQEKSNWNFAKLAEEVQAIEETDIDVEFTGLEEFELEELEMLHGDEDPLAGTGDVEEEYEEPTETQYQCPDCGYEDDKSRFEP